jgi:hypothetical protein
MAFFPEDILRETEKKINGLNCPGFGAVLSEPFCKRVPTPPKTSYKVYYRMFLAGKRILILSENTL